MDLKTSDSAINSIFNQNSCLKLSDINLDYEPSSLELNLAPSNFNIIKVRP